MFEPITPIKQEINSRSSSDETLTANEENDDENCFISSNITPKSSKFPSISVNCNNNNKIE
jgi:hypothetical protein